MGFFSLHILVSGYSSIIMITNQETTKISPRELDQRRDVFLVDVRTPVEFEEKHLSGSELHPLHELRPDAVRERARGREVCLICRSGARSEQAREKLIGAGLENVTVLEGGVVDWEQAGLPLTRGKKGVSLERQVRIAAGTLVLVGVVGAWLLHPALLVLSGFVGAGLIFAGVTDWCGMGLLLARMPWNKRKPSCCEKES